MAYAVRRASASAPTILLAAVIGALALARLVTGPWYAVYAPPGARLLEGWPVAWEVSYYVTHLPTFLGDAPFRPGIAPVHHRTLLNLYLASLVGGWTGSDYLGLALADLGMWLLGCVAAFYAMRRLGASPGAAAAGAALAAASPILISNMWRHDLHVANFATMPIGLWASLALIDERRGWRMLALGLGAIYLLLSLSYQFQWILAPVAVVLLRWRAHRPWRDVCRAVAGGLVLLVVATALLRAALLVVGLGNAGAESTAVRQPDQLVLSQLLEVRSWQSLAALLPGWRHVEATLLAYQPVVLVLGGLGLARVERAAWLAALCASAVSLLAITLYPAPWTAMSAYPFIYLGAGIVCDEVGKAAARPFRRTLAARWTAVGVTAAGVLVLASLTNGDLWGDYRFLMGWWDLYVPHSVF